MADRHNQTLDNVRAATVLPETFNPDDNTIEVVFSTGARVTRYDWRRDEYWIEDLPLRGMDLAELNNGAAVLREHRASLANVIGSVVPDTARVIDLPDGTSEARARVLLSQEESDAELVNKIKGGIVRKWCAIPHRERRVVPDCRVVLEPRWLDGRALADVPARGSSSAVPAAA